MYVTLYTVSQIIAHKLMAVTLSILTGSSKFFHCWKAKKISNKTHITFSTIPSVCCRTTLRNLEVRVFAYLEENADENVTYFDF